MTDTPRITRPTSTQKRLRDLVNVAVDDVTEWVDVYFTDRDRDLLNLVANVIIHRITIDEDDEVSDIVAESYDSDTTEVLSWLA